jgi:hypothetical protein
MNFNAPSLFPIEFPGKFAYAKDADEFVRHETTVNAPDGGEMSGLIAHFLFAANLAGETPARGR